MKTKLLIAVSVLFVTLMVQNVSAITATWSGQYTTVTYSKPDIYSATISWTPLSPSLVYGYKLKVTGAVNFESGTLTTTSYSIAQMYPVDGLVGIEIIAYGYSSTQTVAQIYYRNGILNAGSLDNICIKTLGKITCSLTTYRDSKNNRWCSKIIITHEDNSSTKHPGFDLEIEDAGISSILTANTSREYRLYLANGTYTVYLKPKSCTSVIMPHYLIATFTIEEGNFVTDQNLVFTEVNN